MPALSLCFIFGPKSTVQAASSKITVMFRVQVFYSLFYILCFLTEGLATNFPPPATHNSLYCVSIVLWQEANKFIFHYAWSWQTIISLNFSIKRKVWLKKKPQNLKQNANWTHISLKFLFYFLVASAPLWSISWLFLTLCNKSLLMLKQCFGAHSGNSLCKSQVWPKHY